MELDSYFAVGNIKSPLVVIKRKDIQSYIDDDYWELWDLYRWYKSGLFKVDMSDYPINVLRGIRLLTEINKG